MASAPVGANPSWKMNVGVNHVPAYQVSGRPFASGGIDALPDQAVVNFPYVTRWVQVINSTSASIKVGFGPNSFDPAINNYFVIPSGSNSQRLEVKVSRLYVSGGSDSGRSGGDLGISVVAGLTSILPNRVNSGSTGISWSGSYDGVG